MDHQKEASNEKGHYESADKENLSEGIEGISNYPWNKIQLDK